MNTTKNHALTQVLRKGRQIGNDIFLNTPPTEQYYIDSNYSIDILKLVFLFKFIVTMASGSIPADFIYQLNVMAMQLVQEEDLVDLLLWYHATSD
jgi:hypothetical protein